MPPYTEEFDTVAAPALDSNLSDERRAIVVVDEGAEPALNPRRELGHVPVGIVLVGVLVICYFAWFPFDFVDEGRPFAEVLRSFSFATGRPLWHPSAVPVNVLLFLPFGFGIGCLARGRTSSRHVVVLTSAAVGIVLSTLVEVVQSAWLSRNSEVDDILANTVGAALGGLAWTRLEPAVADAVEWVRRSANRRPWRALWLALSLVPTLLVVVTTAVSSDHTQLGSWDGAYPLVLGNEATGNRPWSGEIAAVSLTDRALTAAQTSAVLGGRPLREVAPGSVLLEYDFTAGQPLPGGLRTGGNEPQPTSTIVGGDGLRVGPDRWVVSSEPPAGLSASIAASGEFTVFLDVTTSSLDQDGPARILTISADLWTRNLTVAQDGADLVVRVRSTFAGTNGSSPELAVSGAFGDGGRHVFVFVYDASTASVTVDNPARTSTIELFAPTVPMVDRFIDDVGRLRFSRLGDLGRESYFAASAFAPWAVVNTLLARRRRASWRCLVPVALLVPVVELVVWRVLPEHRIDRGEVLTAAAVTIAAYAAAASAASRRWR